MKMVVRMNYEKEIAEVLFESESQFECECFVETLENKENVEICDKY